MDTRASPLRLAASAGRPAASVIDLPLALQACQALAREQLFDAVCKTLLALALQHSGAACGMLLLQRGAVRVLAARAQAPDADISLDGQAAAAHQCPLALFDGVARTHRTLLLGATAVLPCGTVDHYIARRAPRSAVGVPLHHHDALVGMLYLEQACAPFPAACLDLLELLALQAAAALDRAELLRQLEAGQAERHRGDEALRQARAELARAARVTTLGQFAASIAHEVSQPLAAAALHAAAAAASLAQHPPRLARARDALEMVQYSATRAGDMVRALRGMACKTGAEPAPFIVDDAVREALLLMRAELQQRAITVVAELGLARQALCADRAQLQQVIMNLVLNAIEALAQVEGRARRLTLRTARDDADGALCISVADNGCGIAAAAAARLFEALFSTKPGGMGMGLSIARAIVDAQGGRIWCDAGAVHGCTFHLRLPAVPSPCANTERTPPP